ncbi:hypothetical protein AAG570_006204 [Ranatra chinensis]|uniref:Uncharacterized protein n=1 Tax=Ranatra chinensis TaxID=642074 RepID=A0ABD0XZY3_9HEMI
MKTEPSLTPSVLVALENLCLESEALYHIQVNLIKSLRKAPIEQVPVYVRLIITGACPSHIDELINGLRSELAVCLPASSLTQGKFSGEELSTVQSLAFDKLKDAVLKSRKLADAWLKNIMKVKNASKHKPIDFVMLLILHCTTTDQVKKKAVETAFRTKIRAGEFNENLVKDTFSTLPGVSTFLFS